MTFPNTQIPTNNLDAASDSPSAARADLYQTVVSLNSIIAGANTAAGVALLDSNGKIPAGRFPQSITYSGAGSQIINPASGIVNIQDIMRLTALPKSDILNMTTSTLAPGDMSMSLDGNSGTIALCLFNGIQWLRLHAQTPLNSTTPVISGSGGDGISLGGNSSEGGSTVSITLGDTTTGAAGTEAVVTNTGDDTNMVLEFTIPAGATGATGASGLAGTITIGSVGTGDAGTTATVVNVGTSTAAILNITIPRGEQGEQGEQGIQGEPGSAVVEGDITVDSIISEGTVNTSSKTTGISGTTAVTIDSWATSTTHAAKYFVTVKDGTTFHASELMVLCDGTDVYVNEYGVVTTDGALGTFTASRSGTTVSVTYTPTGASSMAIVASITRMTV